VYLIPNKRETVIHSLNSLRLVLFFFCNLSPSKLKSLTICLKGKKTEKAQRVWKEYSKYFLVVVFFSWDGLQKILPGMVKQWASFNPIKKINISYPSYGIFLSDLLLPNFSSVNRILHQKYSVIMVSFLLAALA